VAHGPGSYQRQSLEPAPVPDRINPAEELLGFGRHGPVCPKGRRLWCAGCDRRRSRALPPVQSGNLRAGAAQAAQHTDHDPLFHFHRWQANLRILDVETVQTVPQVPWSHPCIERLIGTIRREYLDRLFFWTADDLERKLGLFKHYYNAARVHHGAIGRHARGESGPANSSASQPLELPLAKPLPRVV
jgi:hypothetical protein